MPSKDLRADAGLIIKAALASVDPSRAVKEALKLDGDRLTVGQQTLDLGIYQRIIVVGAGKAGAPMAQAVEQILGERIGAGRVVVKDGHGAPTDVIEIMEASHPVPDDRGWRPGAASPTWCRRGRAGHPVFVPALRRRQRPIGFPGRGAFPGRQAAGHPPALGQRGGYRRDQHHTQAP